MKTIVKVMNVTLFRRWALICAFMLALQLQARAHAFLDHADPKVGGTVTNSPTQVRIWFTQELEPAFSSIRVDDADGKEVDAKDGRVDTQDKSLLEVSLPQLPAGTYTVTWKVVSTDTHRTQGHFKFTINRAG